MLLPFGPVYLSIPARLNHTTNPISQAIFKGSNMQYNIRAVHKPINSVNAFHIALNIVVSY